MEEHEEYGTAPRSTFCVLLRSTHFQEYVSLPRSTFYLGGAHLATLDIDRWDQWFPQKSGHIRRGFEPVESPCTLWHTDWRTLV